ncbi:MAG: di-heme enzyme [Acidobacteria bacterium]|nr:di-heme enzyme [Acidobacteriota bacterium]
MTAGSPGARLALLSAALGCLAGWLSAGGTRPPAEERKEPPPSYEWRLPPGFPPPVVPPDNPLTPAGIELGRYLFYDTRLSGNGTQACATCHRQDLAFTDGRARAVGSTCQVHPRSAMSLANVAYSPVLTWANPRLRSLEDQALVPMFGESPVELGLAGREVDLLARLRGEARYVEMFRAAFPGERDPIRIANVTRALASFERTLISGDSPYDRLVYRDDASALSKRAWSGMRLFFSDRLACSECHGGFNFSGPVVFQGMERPADLLFHNTGLYDFDVERPYPALDTGLRIGAGLGGEPGSRLDTGLRAVTGKRRDTGRFRAPTLRNIALTAPYMHDGSIATLGEVIDHYAAGGRAGGERRLRSPLVRGFEIAEDEKRDLIAFLRCLSDEAFVTNPNLTDPW